MGEEVVSSEMYVLNVRGSCTPSHSQQEKWKLAGEQFLCVHVPAISLLPDAITASLVCCSGTGSHMTFAICNLFFSLGYVAANKQLNLSVAS